MYDYQGKITAVHDGDTVTVDLATAVEAKIEGADVGFHIHIEAFPLEIPLTIRDMKIRMAGINAPELITQAGKDSQKHLSDLILGLDVRVITSKTSPHNAWDSQEKYGRYLATIWVGNLNINQLMVEDGFAVYETYKE